MCKLLPACRFACLASCRSPRCRCRLPRAKAGLQEEPRPEACGHSGLGTGARRELVLGWRGSAEWRNNRQHSEDPGWTSHWTHALPITMRTTVGGGSSIGSASAPAGAGPPREFAHLTAPTSPRGKLDLEKGRGGSERVMALPTAKGALPAGSLGSKAPAPLCSEQNHTGTSGSAHCSLQPVWSLVNGSSNVLCLVIPAESGRISCPGKG